MAENETDDRDRVAEELLAPLTPKRDRGDTGPAPDRERDDKAVRRQRRRRRLWLVGKVAIVLLILSLGLIIYLQTGHALRHVLLPIASRVLGTKITAADGGLRLLSGAIDVRNLAIEGSDGKPAFQAERFYAAIAPSTLLGNDLPTVRDVRLDRSRIVYRIDAAGGNNWSFLPSGGPVAPPPASPQPFPAIRLERLSVVNFSAVFEDGGGLSAALNNLDLSIRDFQPGGPGQVELNGSATLERPEQGIRQKAEFQGMVKVIQHAAGDQLDVDGSFGGSLDGLGVADESLESIRFGSLFVGSLYATGRLQQNLTLKAETPTATVGQVQVEVDWDPERRTHSATARVSEVSREFLNPLLAAFAPVQLTDAAIDAELQVRGEGDRVNYKAVFNAGRLSFKLAANAGASPPLDIEFDHNGSYNLADGAIDLGAMSLDVLRANAPLLDLKLDQPIRLNLASAADASQALDEASALMRLRIHDVTLEIARPWLAMAGIPDAAGLTSARVNGEWTIGAQRQGRSILLNGSLDATQLKHAALGEAVLSIHKEGRVTFENLNDIAIQSARTEMKVGNARLATVSAEGGLKLDTLTGQLTLNVEAPEVLTNLGRLGLLPGGPPAGVTDGRVVVEQKIALAGLTSPIAVEGTTRLEGATISIRGGRPAAIGARVANRLSFNPADGRLAIKQMRVELDQPGGVKPGLVTVDGEWPMTPVTIAGRMQCAVRDVDLAPWLLLTRVLAAVQLPPIPLEVNETLERDESGRINLTGDIRIADDKLSLAIRTELRQFGNRLEQLLIDVQSKSGGPADDHVRIEADGILANPLDTNIKVLVERLNADPYLAAAQRYSPPAGEPAPPPASPPPPPPVLAKVQWDVKQATYQNVALTDAAGTARLENGVLQVKIDRGNLAGGALEGECSYDMARIHPRYAWRMALTQAEVDKLAAAAVPAMAGKLTGTATFDSEGGGEGFGEVMQRTLDSRSAFMIADGELKGLPFLDRLSELTQAETFRNVRFFAFSGNVVTEKGKGSLRETQIKGKDNKLGFSGDFGLDLAYKLRMDPSLPAKLLSNEKYSQYTGAVADADGFTRLPVALIVEGRAADFKMRPTVVSPVGGGPDGEPQKLDETLRGVLGGIVDKKLEERAAKNAPKDDKATSPTQAMPQASAETTTQTTPQSTPKPEKTPKPKVEDQLRGVLEGLIR